MNDNLKNKLKKYKELKKKIREKYKKDIKDIDHVMRVIKNNSFIYVSDTLETIIFKKYLELENVQSVAKSINDLGFRIKTNSYIGERKYTSNDITEILINKDCMVEKELKEIVSILQKNNYKTMVEVWS